MEDRISSNNSTFSHHHLSTIKHAVGPSKRYRSHFDTPLQLCHSDLRLFEQHHACFDVSIDSLTNGQSPIIGLYIS